VQRRLRLDHPNLTVINDEIFAGRALAAGAANEAERSAFLACAPLEEASVTFLETLLASSGS
jgi:hypothetical protein